MSQFRLYELAKEGVISEINNLSEKIRVIEKKIKRSPESKNIELWNVAIRGYETEIGSLEKELIELDNILAGI